MKKFLDLLIIILILFIVPHNLFAESRFIKTEHIVLDNYPFTTKSGFVLIDAIDINQQLNPGEKVVAKKCIVESDATFELSLYLNGINPSPITMRWKLATLLTVTNVSNGEELPCTGEIINDEKDFLISSNYTGQDIVHLSGEGTSTTPFENISEPLNTFRVDYLFTTHVTHNSLASLFSVNYGFISVFNLKIIIEHEIEKDGLDIELNNELRLAQTIFNPDISSNPDPTENDNTLDIVANKPYAIEIEGKVTDIEPGEVFEADIYIEDVLNNTESYYQTINLIVENDKTFKQFLSMPSANNGTYRIRVEADVSDQFPNETNDSNNISYSKNFQVSTIAPLNIGVIEFGSPNCLNNNPCYERINPIDFNSIIDPNNIINISDYFAVPVNNVLIDGNNQSILGNSVSNLFNIDGLSVGFIADYKKMVELGYQRQFRKVIAAVSEEYFIFHNFHIKDASLVTKGVGFTGGLNTGSVIFVSSGENNVIEHELGHIFGSKHDSSPVNGYNNRTNTEINEAVNLMHPNDPIGPFWPSEYTYERSFYALSAPAIDPEIIIVSGTLDLSNNTVKDVELKKYDSGVISQPLINTGYSIETKNSAGEVINSSFFDPNLKIIVDQIDQNGQLFEIEKVLNEVPFVVSLPSNYDVSSISISNNSIILKQIEINEQSFSDIFREVKYSDIIGKSSFLKFIYLWKMKIIAKKLDLAIASKNQKKIKVYSKLLKKVTLVYIINPLIKDKILRKIELL